MATNEKRPPIKESVGAMYICFDVMDDNDGWTSEFEEDVTQLNTVKTVKVTENMNSANIYASGDVYDTDDEISYSDIAVNTIAFPDDILERMRGSKIDENGLILNGGKKVRPFFAYGKVVKMKGGKLRLDWYPKCKLTENTNQASTKEETYSEQTDDLTIRAFQYDADGNNVASVSYGVKWPEGLTESKFFAAPILAPADLTKALTPESQGNG